MKKRRKLAGGLILCFYVMLFWGGCGLERDYSEQGIYFDTLVDIQIYGTKDETVIKECVALCEEYEKKFSRTIEDSEVSKINQAEGQWVEVSEETIEILDYALEYSEMTDGAFDITIAPLTELWNVKENTGKLPAKEEIENALSHVNYENIEIDGNMVRLKDKEAKIDLGGIAKGYIADKLKEFMAERGVKNAMINLGGNIAVIGGKKDGSDWNIGIQKPFGDRNEVIGSVSIRDKTVVSSGIYERYFEYDGKIYHHILDTATGRPAESDLEAVTIIGESSVMADVLSTTCVLLGSEKGMELIERTPEVEAVFVRKDGEVLESGGGIMKRVE